MKAVLIDIPSIQSYIFGSNRLKTNIGASYIIEHLVFKEIIPLVLSEMASATWNDGRMEKWKEQPNKYLLREDEEERVEIGYIGGGNALLIFREENFAREFVAKYSKKILEYFPGLKVAFGIGEFHYEGDAYKDCRNELTKNLQYNRNFYALSTMPFKYGIVDDCVYSNEGQELYYRNEDKYISSLTFSKLKYLDEAKSALSAELLKDSASEEFTFTDDLEQFGLPEDKGYIAIVHADGNGMGKRFRECGNLSETRKLSAGVANYAKKVMSKLIEDFIAKKSDLEKTGFEFKRDEGRIILPIRPIVSGGDDLTFVCDGRLGLYLAKKLLELMRKEEVEDDVNIEACAGVAIVHTKYPFYRAYQMTEELIRVAKKISRKDDSSWLEYFISSGGFSGNYESAFLKKYVLPSGRSLHYGPYKIGGGENDNERTFSRLEEGVRAFLKWPRHKVKELRNVLRESEANQKYFLETLKSHPKNLKLPFEGSLFVKVNRGGGFASYMTPYFDVIEVMDFFPEKLLST